jgi:hypothetical protein
MFEGKSCEGRFLRVVEVSMSGGIRLRPTFSTKWPSSFRGHGFVILLAPAEEVQVFFDQNLSLSVILCVRHNQRQGAYYAEQSEESRP